MERLNEYEENLEQKIEKPTAKKSKNQKRNERRRRSTVYGLGGRQQKQAYTSVVAQEHASTPGVAQEQTSTPVITGNKRNQRRYRAEAKRAAEGAAEDERQREEARAEAEKVARIREAEMEAAKKLYARKLEAQLDTVAQKIHEGIEAAKKEMIPKAEFWIRCEQIVRNYTGQHDLKLVPVSADKSAYIETLKSLEQRRGRPISRRDPEFPELSTDWFFEPGTYIGIEETSLTTVFGFRITRWDAVDSGKLQAMENMMLYTVCVPKIELNGSTKKHGNDKETDMNGNKLKKHGAMYAAGWHGTRGENADISYYAPRKDGNVERRQFLIDTYEDTTDGFAHVAETYADGLRTLFPLGHQLTNEFAIRNDIPSFADLQLLRRGEMPSSMPFANSLTITNRDFANYLHRDNDAIDVAYGWWWPAKMVKKRWVFDKEIGLDRIEGGEFLIAQWGVGIDFQRVQGLVEIFWRGKKDYHVTLASTSPSDITRFGTSVQITEHAVRGMKALERNDYDPDRVIDVPDRVDFAVERLEGEKAKASGKKKVGKSRK